METCSGDTAAKGLMIYRHVTPRGQACKIIRDSEITYRKHPQKQARLKSPMEIMRAAASCLNQDLQDL